MSSEAPKILSFPEIQRNFDIQTMTRSDLLMVLGMPEVMKEIFSVAHEKSGVDLRVDFSRASLVASRQLGNDMELSAEMRKLQRRLLENDNTLIPGKEVLDYSSYQDGMYVLTVYGDQLPLKQRMLKLQGDSTVVMDIDIFYLDADLAGTKFKLMFEVRRGKSELMELLILETLDQLSIDPGSRDRKKSVLLNRSVDSPTGMLMQLNPFDHQGFKGRTTLSKDYTNKTEQRSLEAIHHLEDESGYIFVESFSTAIKEENNGLSVSFGTTYNESQLVLPEHRLVFHSGQLEFLPADVQIQEQSNMLDHCREFESAAQGEHCRFAISISLPIQPGTNIHQAEVFSPQVPKIEYLYVDGKKIENLDGRHITYPDGRKLGFVWGKIDQGTMAMAIYVLGTPDARSVQFKKMSPQQLLEFLSGYGL